MQPSIRQLAYAYAENRTQDELQSSGSSQKRELADARNPGVPGQLDGGGVLRGSGSGAKRPAGETVALSVGAASLAAMDTRQAAQHWADVWQRGWQEHDIPAIEALYADGALWQQHPLRDPEPGYLARVFAEEESADVQFGTPIVDGDRAAVPWTAESRLVNGSTESLAGVSLLRFDPTGLVTEERDFAESG